MLVAIEAEAAPDNTLAASTEDVTAIEAATSAVRIAFAATLLEDVMLDDAAALTTVPDTSRAANGADANG